MDPHQLQNNLNLTGHTQPPPVLNSQAQAAYNQMVLPPTYMAMGMGNFPFYSNNQTSQMNQMNMFSQQSQPQQIIPQLQTQHMVHPQPQVHSNAHHQQQAHIQQQQSSFTQAQTQQHHSALQSQQQMLLEEQQRQLEARRQDELHRQRQKESDEARKQELLLQHQRDKERHEQIRLQEEANRIAEELRKKQEADAREAEKLQRLREEQLRKQQESEKAQKDMVDRVEQIGNPLTLVSTHFLNNFTALLPFPSENMASSRFPSVCDRNLVSEHVSVADPAIIDRIANVLGNVNVDDIRTRLDNHEGFYETNDLPLDQLPPVIRMVIEHNENAFDVEQMHNLKLDDHDLLTNLPEYHTQAQSATVSATGLHHEEPSTSGSTSDDRVQVQVDSQDAQAIQYRRQMASVGKQPKVGGGNQRKKRDMVESLFDSLTDYFDPTEGRRRRVRTKTLEEVQAEQADLDAIARMEASEQNITEEGNNGVSNDENKFFEKKRKRKRADTDERPPTPTEVVQQREIEWNERQRKRIEKRRRQHITNDDEYWNTDVMAENESFTRFMGLVEQVTDQMEELDVQVACSSKKTEGEEDLDDEDEVNPEYIIERQILNDIRDETTKLKSWRKLNKVPVDRLVRLVTVLERNMRDVLGRDGTRSRVMALLDDDADEGDAAFRELLTDRLLRAADAAVTVLMIMTSYKMPKQVFIEDAIERSISLSKQYLDNIVYPASDSMFKTGNKKLKDEIKRKRKSGTNNRSPAVQQIYSRMAELFSCFAELIRAEILPETAIHQLATISIATFFVSNVGELQSHAMDIASNIFAIAGDNIRISILTDILNSLHRLPAGKNTNNSYRLGSEQWVSNTTILVMQLIQSVVKMPKRRKNEDDGCKADTNPDTVVKNSFQDAQKLSGLFLGGFLAKCSCKGNKSDGEEDYRRLFDAFLQDLLLALYKPEWPSAEMMLTLLGSLLVKNYRNKSTDIIVRQASLDYLGSVTARLRKDTKVAVDDSEKRMELVVKTLLFEEQEEGRWEKVEDIDINDLSHTDRLKRLEQALIDYLVEKRRDDSGTEYAIRCYAAEWYKETAEDLDNAKQQFKLKRNQEMSEKERRKLEKRMERMKDKGSAMKEFLVKLVDKKHLRKRAEMTKRLGNVMLDADAFWAVKYLASRREFSHSFDIYLKHILYGVTMEGIVSLRTRAMKCLTQIIEADHEVLKMTEVQQAVNSRMVDPNAAVREATLELLGKFLLVNESFIPSYYSILCERIKDSGTAVRKRVIRIMREICEKYPDYEKIPDMLSKVIRRISDEDGVKKLVQDTFSLIWFQPCSERSPALVTKVLQMTEVAQICVADSTIDCLEQLFQSLVKLGDKSLMVASKQIVDSLVDNVLAIENKIANDSSTSTTAMDVQSMAAARLQNSNQERLLACLTTLSMFSKVKPGLMVQHAETLQPYLAMKATTPAEQQVLNEVIGMLERVVPLMPHPSDSFLSSIDSSLTQLSGSSGMILITSSVSCASSIWHKFPRYETGLIGVFLSVLKFLNGVKSTMDNNPNFVFPAERVSLLQRGVFSIGLMTRYFDFDSMLLNNLQAEKSLRKVILPPEMNEIHHKVEDEGPVSRLYRDNVFMLLEFFTRHPNAQLKAKSITSIGHLCAQYADYLGRKEIKNIYYTVLGNDKEEFIPLRIQALKNLEMFLQTEEKKMIKSHEDWDKSKETQNLKEMELAGSGLGSAVIQIYWIPVLNCYFSHLEAVRQAAAHVTHLTLSQGLVTPGNSIPTLIAMTTDPLTTIRNRIESLLKDIDTKYQGMVQSKSINGVRTSFKLHSKIARNRNSAIRGIRSCDSSALATCKFFLRFSNDTINILGAGSNSASGLPKYTNDGQALLSGLYINLRLNRSQRRSFMNTVLRLFSEDSRDKLEIDEWIFVADNIAMFPYQVMDEPLYAIRHIDSIIALSGQTIVNQFKENLRPSHQPEDDDTIFQPENLFRRFPDDKSPLYKLILNSQACFILLYLKQFLMKLYGFTDQKVQEYSPSEAAKVYEKPVNRKNVLMFQPISALEELKPEVIQQRNTMPGDYNLAHKICSFRQMLLSLDKTDDNDVEENDGSDTIGVIENPDDDDIDGDLAGSGGENQPMEE